MICSGLHSGLVVSMLDFQLRCSGLKSRPGSKFGLRFLLHLANSAMSNTLTISGKMTWRLEDWPLPSDTKAKKMKMLRLHTHGCLRASLRTFSSSSESVQNFVLKYFWCMSNYAQFPKYRGNSLVTGSTPISTKYIGAL